MAKPYKDGAGWAYRLRVAGQDIFRSGFSSAAKARADMDRVRQELVNGPAQSGLGPHRTSLGVAFSDYARQRLPYLKGAAQDARRINRYLRALRLPVVELSPVEVKKEGQRVYWTVSFVEEPERAVPHSLLAHRASQAVGSEESDKLRGQLARMNMADVTTHHIQKYIKALQAEGKKSATIHLERSELRRLFKHASAVWKWRRVDGNPAGADLDMPELDAGRDRVLTNDEWEGVFKELLKYRNPHVAPLACLMLETAMRSCEPLTTLRWQHINWTRRVLELPDGKTGGRDVPLTPGAIVILGEVARHTAKREPDDRVFPTTYEAVKKAWAQACKAAGVEGVHLHDLRHTSATRFALEYQGNLPVIMLITGHKTVQMAMRYVNLKADDVVRMMHCEETNAAASPAGYGANVAEALAEALKKKEEEEKEKKGRKRARQASGTDGERSPEFRPAHFAESCTVTSPEPERASVQVGNVILVEFKKRAA